MKTVKTVPCPACSGTGTRPGPITGAAMRAERNAAGLTRDQVAAHFRKPGSRSTYTLSYVVDLERDKRAWSMAMVESYRAAIKAAKK